MNIEEEKLNADTKMKPLIIDAFAYNGNSAIVGGGMSFANKKLMLNMESMQHIVNAHLNNNNWLKRHRKPMIRKGHPLYERCQLYKGERPFENIIISDPKSECIRKDSVS